MGVRGVIGGCRLVSRIKNQSKLDALIVGFYASLTRTSGHILRLTYFIEKEESKVVSVIEETREQQDKRMAWWREAKFGMFIHWGLYSLSAGMWKGEYVSGTGEWIQHQAQIPVREYEQLAKQFNPVRFNAKEWVRMPHRELKWEMPVR